ncbi:MAG TPA: hypothetical protein VLA19_04995 [Herpetosiphonaceae bacterium]|nr:hypothetical protein [Herpetosiphonaceae bacterium]
MFTSPAAEARLDRPEVVAALERPATIVRSGAIYDSLNCKSDANDLIDSWRAGIWVSDMLSPKRLGANTGAAPYPALPLPLISGDADGYIMSSGT